MEAFENTSARYIEISYESDVIWLQPSGGLDFTSLSQVLKQVENGTLGDQVRECNINMEKVGYIDSSVLGGFIILREKLGGNSSVIRLTNCTKEVKKILEVANLNSLFQIG